MVLATPGRAAWPTSRWLAAAGVVLGLLVGVLLLAGGLAGWMPVLGPPEATAFGLVGIVGALHLLLGAGSLVSVALLPRGPRLHGGLLALWGALGMFVGFGAWVGSALVLAGGLLALAHSVAPGAGRGQRPVV